MRRPAAVLALCVPLLATAPLALAQEAAPLRLTPADPVRLVVEQEHEVVRPAQGSDPVRERATTRTYLVQVSEAAAVTTADAAATESTLTLSATLERLQTTSRASGGDLVVDTDTPDGAAAPEGRFVGQPVVCRVSPRGELLEVEEALGTEVATLPREQRCRLQGLVGDGVMRDAVLGFAAPFPAGGLAVGTTWSSRAIVQGPAAVGELALVVTNRAVEVGPDVVVIEQTGAREDEARAPTTVTVTRCEGRLVLSRTDGLIVESQGALTLEVGVGDDRLIVRSTCRRRRAGPTD